MEETQTQENPIIDDKQNNLNEINNNLKTLITFFENEKKENQVKEQEQKKLHDKELLKIKEDKKEQEKKELQLDKDRKEFYDNIKTICENTKSETTNKTLSDVSSLMQVSIITNGLIIGILCITLFAKFFKKNT